MRTQLEIILGFESNSEGGQTSNIMLIFPARSNLCGFMKATRSSFLPGVDWSLRTIEYGRENGGSHLNIGEVIIKNQILVSLENVTISHGVQDSYMAASHWRFNGINALCTSLCALVPCDTYFIWKTSVCSGIWDLYSRVEAKSYVISKVLKDEPTQARIAPRTWNNHTRAV